MNGKIFQLVLIAAAVLVLIQPRAARAATTGSSLYQANCATCHGPDGSGSVVGKSLHVLDLRSAKVQSKSNAALARFIGQGSGAMPPFQYRFDHQQILDVVRYVRSFAKLNP